MDSTGKVVAILQPQSFASGKIKNSFAIETSGQYPKKLCFDVWGQERWDKLSPYVRMGADVQVFFDAESREWNGKYFTQLTAYKVTALGGANSQQPPAAAYAQSNAPSHAIPAAQAPAPQDDNALPF